MLFQGAVASNVVRRMVKTESSDYLHTRSINVPEGKVIFCLRNHTGRHNVEDLDI